MLDQTTRQTILRLHEAGHGTRAIARALQISRGAVKAVLVDGRAEPPPLARSEKAESHRDDILALYTEACRQSDAVLDEALLPGGAGLDGLSADSDEGVGRYSLRWIILHMVEEYARHNGHADLLRESIDGVTGE